MSVVLMFAVYTARPKVGSKVVPAKFGDTVGSQREAIALCREARIRGDTLIKVYRAQYNTYGEIRTLTEYTVPPDKVTLSHGADVTDWVHQPPTTSMLKSIRLVFPRIHPDFKRLHGGR